MPEAPDPDDSAFRHVFVYGTLRRGGHNDINRFRPAPRYIGTAQIEGVMHHLGAYPGVRLLAGGTVQGEVYAVVAEVERLLDELEMILPEPTGEYLKCMVPVQVGTQWLDCIVYEISAGHADGRPVIASGDWIANKDG